MSPPASLPLVDFDQLGPRLGEPFPEVVLPNQRGQLVHLHRARAGRRAWVMFQRSAKW